MAAAGGVVGRGVEYDVLDEELEPAQGEAEDE